MVWRWWHAQVGNSWWKRGPPGESVPSAWLLLYFVSNYQQLLPWHSLLRALPHHHQCRRSSSSVRQTGSHLSLVEGWNGRLWLAAEATFSSSFTSPGQRSWRWAGALERAEWSLGLGWEFQWPSPHWHNNIQTQLPSLLNTIILSLLRRLLSIHPRPKLSSRHDQYYWRRIWADSLCARCNLASPDYSCHSRIKQETLITKWRIHHRYCHLRRNLKWFFVTNVWWNLFIFKWPFKNKKYYLSALSTCFCPHKNVNCLHTRVSNRIFNYRSNQRTQYQLTVGKISVLWTTHSQLV